MSVHPFDGPTRIFLVGTGVVGRAILKAHVDAGLSIWIADLNEASLLEAVGELGLSTERWSVSGLNRIAGVLPSIQLRCHADQTEPSRPIVIESILEKLDVKHDFFTEAEDLFGNEAVFCSNTSTLRVSRIAEPLEHPDRMSGMHFFMPVYNRAAVEVIGGDLTSQATLDHCVQHVMRLGKSPLLVGDGPGFVVNRLLSPYLNEAMLMLCRGNSADKIERAARAYGMPMSPLELIDWIGTRTMFDAGRAYWQAFPNRLDPAPMLVAMVKKKRLGRATGQGLYEYIDGKRSVEIATQTIEFSEKYRRVEICVDEGELMHVLSIPMWIEAAIAYRDGIVRSHTEFDLAMQGGLGFDANTSWLGYFDSLGSERMLQAIQRWSERTKAMNAPSALKELLANLSPTEALVEYARHS